MTKRLVLLGVALALIGGAAGCGGTAPVPSPSPTTPGTPTEPMSPAPAPAIPDSAYDVHAYGARGDGESDDTQALLSAMAAAAEAGGGVVGLPEGTYLCPGSEGIILPDGVSLQGEGASASWLKGRLNFGSRSRISDLKIGDLGTCAVSNAPGASATRFTRCRLHGGGSREGPDSSVVYLGGDLGNVRDILFADCEIERTSYQPPAGMDAYAANVGNTITIHEFTHLPDDGHVAGITFRDCHLGASNGRATGALRMMMEAYSWDGRTGRVHHGWRNLTFDGCTIEASDTTGLDFADGPLTTAGKHSADGVLITGCTFLGARTDETYAHGGLPIVYEGPTGIVIKDNYFYAVPQSAIGGSHIQRSKESPGLLIQGNTFDMTRSPIGLEHQTGEACISLVGHNSRVLNNTFLYDAGWGVVLKAGGGNTVFATAGNVLRGNTFTDTRITDGEPTIVMTDDHDFGCYDNRITANEITNRGAGRAGVIAQISGSGVNYATDNVIDCGDSVPFLVSSGRIVQTGNRLVGGR